MPQAPARLNHWNEERAWAQLTGHFQLNRGGMIYPINGHVPDEQDDEAIDYLCMEWHYGYLESDPSA